MASGFSRTWVARLLVLTMVAPQGLALRAQAPKTAAAAAAAATPPVGTNADTGWPRTVTLKTGTAVWYQPQVESWTNQKQVVGWAAVSYTPSGAKEPALGTIKLEAHCATAPPRKPHPLGCHRPRVEDRKAECNIREQGTDLFADETRPFRPKHRQCILFPNLSAGHRPIIAPGSISAARARLA